MLKKAKVTLLVVLSLVLVFSFTGYALADDSDHYHATDLQDRVICRDSIYKTSSDPYMKDDNTYCTGAGMVYTSYFLEGNIRVSDFFQIQSGHSAYDYDASITGWIRLCLVNAYWKYQSLEISGYQKTY